MSAAQASLRPELEDALRHITIDRHGEAVARVADFFLADPKRFSDEQVHLFDRVLGRLIVTIEAKALAELARRLAPVRNAPRDVIRRLARNPDIAVAAPVLSRSTLLDDKDLVDIALTTSQAHLLAISGRAGLCEAVTDVLADCGDRDVARNLVMNHAARLSETGFDRLAQRAAHDAILAEKLAQRSDVPPNVLCNLARFGDEAVQQRVLTTVSVETLTEIQDAIADMPVDAAADAEAQRAVRALQRAGKLDEARVLEFANAGRVRDTIAAIALLCDVPLEVARRLLADEPDAALILCQAAGLSWPAACAILKACNGGRANALDTPFAEFDRLTTATAESIVGFWRACSTAQAA